MYPPDWKSFTIGLGIIFVAVHVGPLLDLKEWWASAEAWEVWVVTAVIIGATVCVPLTVVYISKYALCRKGCGRI